MSWISIDPAGTAVVARVMVAAGHATLALLARVRGLGDQAGLGDLRGSVAAEAGAAASAIERYTEAWLLEGRDALQRAITLVQDQRASAVVGTVPSAYDSILGGSMIIGGASAAAWSQVGSVGGTTVTIGGGVSDNPLLLMSSVIQDRQDSMRAKLAAASGARVVGSADPVAAAMATRMWNQINDKIAATGSLVVAPTGARLGSGGGPSAGYTTVATYGDERIEVPDY